MNTFFKFVQPTYVLLAFFYIFFPHTVEAKAFYASQSSPEFISGLLLQKPVVEDQFLDGSRFSGLLNVVNEAGENFLELGTGFDKTRAPLSSGGKPMRNEPSQTSANKAEKPQILAAEGKSEYFHAILFNIFTWIILPLLYAAGHND